MYETMDELEAAVRRRLYRMRDLADDLKAVRATETDPDGIVTAEVDGTGALIDLTLSQEVSRLTPHEFEDVVVRTAAAAAYAAFARRAELVVAFNSEVADWSPTVHGAGPKFP
ncbi:YbaB/EbfC family nucleoid-associated protein [Nocardia huaxiensis]|uniref:YbaB/EbfC family nucleoid-associated protein n=1 Tax=Nocardia huaxiensis TaxID=2755382 RepID=A0A7D6VG35_9NOCA|nr:YbaB/EbfC family nucleoid-associated protein [Nocardia huaxiensis]QLY31855.1 YbaB/EbfC family nucleoid-associated protein [Nocardia huaxiensis]UFS95419.1 YbaB/EbfC family nucleoid-associated protein [Nocardia huaxiensis]